MSNRYQVPITFTFKQEPIPSEQVNQNNAYWAAAVNELVDNFMGISPPSSPTVGMLWLDTSGTRPVLRIYEGGIFKWFGIDVGTSGELPANPRKGAIYHDTDDDTSEVYDGSAWVSMYGNLFDEYIATSLGTAKGDLIVFTGSGVPSAVAVGTDNYVLMADSTETSGVKWGELPPSTDPIQVTYIHWMIE